MSFRKIHHAYIADNARVLGEVELGENVSIWYGVMIRGDVAPVVIGAHTNVQDNSVIHCVYGCANIIGSYVTIGHGAVLHGERVGDRCLIGMGAVLLDHSRIGDGCVIAAGALVPPRMEVPDGSLVVGVPGKVVRQVNESERAFIENNPPHYLKLAQLHAEQPEHELVKPYDGSYKLRQPTPLPWRV